MIDNEVYARLGMLEQLVKHLYEKTGVQMPDLQSLARTEVSARVRQLAAARRQDGRHRRLPAGDERRPGHGEEGRRGAVEPGSTIARPLAHAVAS
jgi:hypothetical protein